MQTFFEGGVMAVALNKSPVDVYDHEGRLVGIEVLKKNDLLIVYWNKKPRYSDAITQDIQGTLHHFSLVVFSHIDQLNPGFHGRSYLPCDLFRWSDISKIHLAGYDSTGRILNFVSELYDQMGLAQGAADKMRKNIDALKA